DHGLQLPLVLEAGLPAWQVIGEDQRSDRLGGSDLGYQRRAGEVRGPRRHVQPRLLYVPNRPAARDRDALSIGLTLVVVDDVKLWPEDIHHLVVSVGD